MSYILSIETATEVCAVTLAQEGKPIAVRESHEARAHAKLTGQFVDELLEEVPDARKKLSAIAVSQGPGSYTGLRIGVSTAKGLAFGLDAPLIAISTLQVIAREAAQKHPLEGAWYAPVLDARRMEVYIAYYDRANQPRQKTQALEVAPDTFDEVLARRPLVFAGNASEKIAKQTSHPNAHFLHGLYPSAQAMAAIAHEKFISQDFVDVAYFEPFYLKDFIPTIPRKNVLG